MYSNITPMGLREKSKRAIFNGSKIGKKYRKKRVKVAENRGKKAIILLKNRGKKAIILLNSDFVKQVRNKTRFCRKTQNSYLKLMPALTHHYNH